MKDSCKECGKDITREPNAARINLPDDKMAIAKPSYSKDKRSQPIHVKICWKCLIENLENWQHLGQVNR